MTSLRISAVFTFTSSLMFIPPITRKRIPTRTWNKNMELLQTDIYLALISLRVLASYYILVQSFRVTWYLNWSIKYRRLWHIYRCYILIWRIKKFLLPHNLSSGADHIPLVYCSFCLNCDLTNTIIWPVVTPFSLRYYVRLNTNSHGFLVRGG